MTDPSADGPRDPQRQPHTARRPSLAGRRAVIGVFATAVGALIVHGAVVIHKDVLEVPAGGTADPDCAAGLHRLHDGIARVLAARRDGHRGSIPAALEHDLRALRPRCEQEGPAAAAAYEALLRWRYRAEDQARLWADALAEDAARALGYHSPQTGTHR